MAAMTLVAFIGAPGTTTLGFTLVVMHSLPSPSGKTFSPHDTAALVSMMTCLSAGITAFHLSVVPSDVVSSIIDFDRSSSSRISAGFRSTSKLCRPQVRPPPPPVPVKSKPPSPIVPPPPSDPPVPAAPALLPTPVLPPPFPPLPLAVGLVPAVHAIAQVTANRENNRIGCTAGLLAA